MLTPADELLVCCARVALDDQSGARLSQLLRAPQDWSLILRKGWWHRIRPLVHRHLASQPGDYVPSDVLEQLACLARELAARNLRLQSMLAEVARIFEVHQLRMLVFKGTTLSEDAYGSLALRECGDIDILVHPDDFPTVRRILGEHGFTSSWDQSGRKRQVFGCEFIRDHTELDVHWHLAPAWFNYRVPFEALWSAGQGLDDASRFARKLRPEDSAVVLCIHGAKHWWERLRWVCDIAELVNSNPGMDWDGLWASATAANARRTVDLGLKLASDLLNARIPADIEHQLRQSTVMDRQSSQVVAWLAHDEQSSQQRRLRERFLFRLRLCERARDRIPQIMHYLWAAPQG